MRNALLVWGLLTLSSCAPLSTTYEPIAVVIEVRDVATGRPIEDAVVTGGVNALFNPDSQPGALGQPGRIPGFVVVNEPSDWAVRTDLRGRVDLQLAGGNPNSLTISKHGYDRIHACIETGVDGVTNGDQWQRDSRISHRRPGRAESHQLEFRVVDRGSGTD